ncbi:MAG TPA: DsbA family oxidoreductase [Aggregatilineales bacterium]|nr:DsbA family oxidoreductase [Aggregatilineales bacterium]
MRVEIWSDIVCPWCYIGRRRFEKALARFEHRDQVEIVWRSFQLDPNWPRQYDGTVNDLLMQKYGMGRREAEAAHEKVIALAAEEGLDYRFDIARPGNSFDAHRVLHLAAQHGLQGEMKERLQHAYFTEGLAYSDHATLVKLASEVGLDADEVRKTLETDAYAPNVRADMMRARLIGINGVPFFLFDEKYAVSGAQRSEVFTTALERTWQDFHQAVEVIDGGQDGEVCEDESCAL